MILLFFCTVIIAVGTQCVYRRANEFTAINTHKSLDNSIYLYARRFLEFVKTIVVVMPPPAGCLLLVLAGVPRSRFFFFFLSKTRSSNTVCNTFTSRAIVRNDVLLHHVPRASSVLRVRDSILFIYRTIQLGALLQLW